MKSIALYGGSFDPPHIGHEAVVKALEKLDYIDKIIIMPTFLNPFKENVKAPAKLRLQWLKEIFAQSSKVEVSSFEIDKARKVPTIETIEALKKRYQKIYLVIGADNLASLHKWHQFEKLQEYVTFIVASRDNTAIPSELKQLKVDVTISSTDLREDIDISKLPKKCANEIAHYYNRRKIMQTRIEKITEVLDKNKAEAIEVFDLRNKDYFVDYAIIASSLGQKHTVALLDHLKKELKPQENFNHVDESGDWVVIDLGDILIHIMTPEYRVKYDMESFLNELGKETHA
jgi:nicotinate-nucleotide adenylyltransferase